MGFEWNTDLLRTRSAAATTAAAERFALTADVDFALRIDGPGLDGVVSVIPDDMEKAMVREYGTAEMDPDRWVLPALMEMARGPQ